MSPDYVPNYEHCVLPYTQFYQDDFLGGVRGMRSGEIGIYTILLMEMYARGRALDISDDRLARLCGADPRAFRSTLQMLIDDGKIIRLNCGLWNERCENAFKSRAEMQDSRSAAGKESARKRKENKGPVQQPFNNRSTTVQLSSEAQNTDTDVSGAKAPKDAKCRLFSEGIQSLIRQTGKNREAVGKLIGRWRKETREDDAKVLQKIQQAEAKGVADPVAWITKALQEQSEYDFIWARG